MAHVDSTGGVRLAVHDLGGTGGTGDAILFAHATGFHGLVWRPLARCLDGFRSVAPDLRGHGDSTAPSGLDYRWDGFADDVLAVVDGLGLAGTRAVGHSMGGAALLLAEQRRPGTFAALYVYEPVVFPPEWAFGDGENPLAAGAERRRATFPSYEAAVRRYATRPPLDELRADALEDYVAHGFTPSDGEVRLKCPPAHEAAVFRMSTSADVWSGLPDVRCPTVVAFGSDDRPGPVSVAPTVAERLADGKAERFEGLGHFGPLQDPPTVAASIEQAFR